MLKARNIPLILLAGILTACSKPGVLPTETLSAEDRMRYRELYTAGLLANEASDVTGAYLLFDRALRIAPDEAPLLYQIAMLTSYMPDTTGVIEKSDSFLRRAISLSPDNYEYKEALARSLIVQKNMDAALPIFEELSTMRKQDEQILGTLISLYFSQNKYDKALSALDRLETLTDEAEVVAGGRLLAYTGLGDTLRAMQVLEDYVRTQPDTLSAKVWAGLRYLDLGRKEQALSEWQDVENIDPDLPQLQLAQFMYYGSNDADATTFRKLVRRGVLNPRLNPQQRSMFLRVCTLYMLLNDSQTDDDGFSEKEWAQSVLEEAYRRPDCDETTVRAYAQALQESNADFADKEPVLRRLLEFDPTENQARLQLIMFYREQGNMKAYFELCHEAQEHVPDELIFYYVEGVQHYQQDDVAAALDVLRRGVEVAADSTLYPDLTSDTYALIGDLLHESERYEEAFAAYEEALLYNPKNLMCMNNYAYFLSLAGKNLDRAQELSRKTVDAEPQNATYLDTYAWVLFQNGQPQQARIYEEQALKYISEDDNAATYYDHLGDILSRLGEMTEAKVQWKKALDLSEDAELSTEIKKKLR